MATASKDHWSAEDYKHHASFVPKLGSIILEMLNAQPDERILDFGCGDGILTAELAKRCKSVVGIDSSRVMIDKAKQSFPGDGNIEYHVADGQELALWFQESGQQPFDAVFSNAGTSMHNCSMGSWTKLTVYVFSKHSFKALHWMKEPIKAIRSVRHVLKRNGRFVAEAGAFLNCAGISNICLLIMWRSYILFLLVDVHNALIAALNRRGLDGKGISPWYFPSTEAYSRLLEENGFKVVKMESVPRPTQLPSDIAGWIRTFGFNFLDVLKNEEEREQMIQEVVEYLRPGCQREDGTWFIMYVRLRFIARKE